MSKYHNWGNCSLFFRIQPQIQNSWDEVKAVIQFTITIRLT